MGLALALAVVAPQQIHACAFHSYVPDPTLVDFLLASEHVVLARPTADGQGVRVVSGLVGPSQAVALPAGLDNETKAFLARSQRAKLLYARDGAYGPWTQLAVLDPGYEKLVKRVIAQRETWLYDGDQGRFQLFAKHLNSNNPDIRRLALLELDRADYGLLRNLRLPRMTFLQTDKLSSDEDLEPIRVLMTGLSGDASYAGRLQEGLAKGITRDLPYLGAYATALIELKGAQGVDMVVRQMVDAKQYPVTLRERMIEALAIHGQTGDKRVKRAIEAQVPALLQTNPDLAPAVARQFGARADWRYAKDVNRAMQVSRPTTIADVFAANQYIGIAQKSGLAID
ncbi:hypothetical protein J7443_05195 [Tropicibacter sp. R15_0]|uniref:hypothetical protein n=1 Tax=Tropicibacter sp. R15_0 TaxID=2821101 RepID=UPI001ADAFEDC|nr:hypothetical protein [Tropicibacter sp. R15_0]MBO9464616.1 hypothetical protein [Tropicibacter sp. R15_0]